MLNISLSKLKFVSKNSSRAVILTLATMFALTPFLAAAAELDEPVFNTLQFENRWVEQDRLAGKPGVQRFYTWGPVVPGAETVRSEPYRESPDGLRLVQYFDKSRMEINQPFNGSGIVTTGLLVRDLVSGQRQDGDNTFTTLPPSQTQVAGDDVSVNPNTPVYASFKNLITFGTPDSSSQPSRLGTQINQFINKAGNVTNGAPPEALTIGAYQAETGHNIAKVFEDFKNLRGPITDPATGARLENRPVYTTNPTINVFGYAVTEPYWVSTKVAGVDRVVLVQLFQRRVLTYNPAIPGASKVEMGNVGQHYFKWRYVENKSSAFPTTNIPAAGCLPAATISGNAVQGCVNTAAPAKGTNVTVYGRLIVGGKVISGVEMETTWYFFQRQASCISGKSGGDGVASCTLNTGEDSAGYLVDVLIQFTYNGTTYQSKTEFTPR